MKDLLSLDRIALNISVTSKQHAFEEIGRMVYTRRGPKPEEIANRLWKRESRSSTAQGYGIALPHAQVKGLSKPIAAFLRPKEPLAFDAPDGLPVTQVCALLVPKPATAEHFDLLTQLTLMFSDRRFRQLLGQCNASLSVWQLFEQWPYGMADTTAPAPLAATPALSPALSLA